MTKWAEKLQIRYSVIPPDYQDCSLVTENTERTSILRESLANSATGSCSSGTGSYSGRTPCLYMHTWMYSYIYIYPYVCWKLFKKNTSSVKIVFLSFYVGKDQTEKKSKTQKWRKTKKNMDIVCFKVVIKKWEIKKHWFLAKNCLTLVVSRREKNDIFVHTTCLGQAFFDKNSQNEDNYKNSGFSGNCPTPRM